MSPKYFTVVFCFLAAFSSCKGIQSNVWDGLSKETKLYWNVPSFQCKNHNIFFSSLAEKYGIVQNANDSFRGEKLTILYDPGMFPSILINQTSGEHVLRNGGLPQEGNLTVHLQHYIDSINEQIPDVNNNGVVIIDFEGWRPIFRQHWAALAPIKELSLEIEKQRHPTWSDAQILEEATRRFELHAREFMQETLQLSKVLRPSASWGYYAYPYCYNRAEISCDDTTMSENDRINWLFNNSDILYPSLYLQQNTQTAIERERFIIGGVQEAQRVGKSQRIMPYFWYKYQDTDNFLAEEDMQNAIAIFKALGVDGVIMWGASNDVSSKERCQALYDYVDNILGPSWVSY